MQDVGALPTWSTMFEERMFILSDTAKAVWEMMTCAPAAPIWTHEGLCQALNKYDYEITEALDELFLEGYIQPCVHITGWRRI